MAVHGKKFRVVVEIETVFSDSKATVGDVEESVRDSINRGWHSGKVMSVIAITQEKK